MTSAFAIPESPEITDLIEARMIFEPLNDLSVITALWNAGAMNRQQALAMADEDCRRAQTPKENRNAHD